MTRYFEQQDRVLDCHTIVLPLVDLAKQRGIHPDKLLKGTQLFYNDIVKGKVRISHQQLVKLVANVTKQVNQHDSAFLIGRRMFPANLGLVGNALMNCENIADMIRVIRRYQLPVFPQMFLTSKVLGDKHYFRFNPSIATAHLDYQIFIYELLACAITNALKWRLGYLPELTIRFPYKQPRYIEQYQVNLDCDFDFCPSGHNLGLQITISSKFLTQPFPDSNSILKRHYLRQIPQYYRRVGLQQYILQLMAKHKEVTLEQVSHWLDVSPATLKRKLYQFH